MLRDDFERPVTGGGRQLAQSFVKQPTPLFSWPLICLIPGGLEFIGSLLCKQIKQCRRLLNVFLLLRGPCTAAARNNQLVNGITFRRRDKYVYASAV